MTSLLCVFFFSVAGHEGVGGVLRDWRRGGCLGYREETDPTISSPQHKKEKGEGNDEVPLLIKSSSRYTGCQHLRDQGSSVCVRLWSSLPEWKGEWKGMYMCGLRLRPNHTHCHYPSYFTCLHSSTIQCMYTCLYRCFPLAFSEGAIWNKKRSTQVIIQPRGWGEWSTYGQTYTHVATCITSISPGKIS